MLFKTQDLQPLCRGFGTHTIYSNNEVQQLIQVVTGVERISTTKKHILANKEKILTSIVEIQ